MKTPVSPVLSRAAFTLIELLVVISIIAMLAGIALPVMNKAMISAQMNAALQNARQIGLGMHLYAGDHDGAFPNDTDSAGNPISTSNDAFRCLFPAYVDNEKIFTVARSKVGAKADNKMGTPSEILKAGENHFAFIAGPTSSSNSLWPLIVDGSDGSGFFTETETDLGGTWKGTKAIVVRVDNSAAAVALSGAATRRFIPQADDVSKNLLDVEYMGAGANRLEPAR